MGMRAFFRSLLSFIVVFLPWKIRRFILNHLYHYQIHPTARIGFSYIYPRHLVMKEGSRIGHLNVAIHLDKMEMGKNSIISRGNWITGFPLGTDSRHFSHKKERKSELLMGDESAITKNHHIDCTDSIRIGAFVTVSGYASQFLTHSIDIYEGRQDCHPIIIGDYSFVGTRVTVLGGSQLPGYSVLGAGAVLNKKYTEAYKLYAGVPAKPIKDIAATAKYFGRQKGFID